MEIFYQGNLLITNKNASFSQKRINIELKSEDSRIVIKNFLYLEVEQMLQILFSVNLNKNLFRNQCLLSPDQSRRMQLSLVQSGSRWNLLERKNFVDFNFMFDNQSVENAINFTASSLLVELIYVCFSHS